MGTPLLHLMNHFLITLYSGLGKINNMIAARGRILY
jgi:hypothetical protein